MKFPSTTYKLYTYDLWGNDEDGYDINDYYTHSDTFVITDDMTDKEVIALLDFNQPETIEIDSNYSDSETFYFVDNVTGKPICELRPI